MDAKPLKTHIRSFRAFRIIGTCLSLTGGTTAGVMLLTLFATLFITYSCKSVYPGNPEFTAFWDKYWIPYVALLVSIAAVMVMIFAAGIVFLALSTRSKIRDANRGIDYQELNK